MLNQEERRLIHHYAYLPEHLPDYVQSISGDEPFLHENHLCFFRKGHLTFIGYPLADAGPATPEVYASACERFKPRTSAIIAPRITRSDYDHEAEPEDHYYRLDLPVRNVKPDVAYMVRRAARDLRVRLGEFAAEHRALVDAFLTRDGISREHKKVFKDIPTYLKRSVTARLLEARRGDELVAFNVLDLGSRNYGFYLFNFRSPETNVPGASDLLFHAMALLVYAEGKPRLNLGLGIHSGVRRFKEKWGGVPFLPYATSEKRRTVDDLLALMKRL